MMMVKITYSLSERRLILAKARSLLARSNPNHEPAGSSEGGQFAPGDGGGGGGGDDSSSSGSGIPSHYVEAAHAYQANPSESNARATMTKLSNLTVAGAEFSKLHAGAITVYRAGGVKKTGLSFSKSLAEARKQLFQGETKIVKLTLTKRDPALDMNKIVPDSRYSHEQEVFIDFRKIDQDRIKVAEKDLAFRMASLND